MRTMDVLPAPLQAARGIAYVQGSLMLLGGAVLSLVGLVEVTGLDGGGLMAAAFFLLLPIMVISLALPIGILVAAGMMGALERWSRTSLLTFEWLLLVFGLVAIVVEPVIGALLILPSLMVIGCLLVPDCKRAIEAAEEERASGGYRHGPTPGSMFAPRSPLPGPYEGAPTAEPTWRDLLGLRRRDGTPFQHDGAGVAPDDAAPGRPSADVSPSARP